MSSKVSSHVVREKLFDSRTRKIGGKIFEMSLVILFVSS